MVGFVLLGSRRPARSVISGAVVLVGFVTVMLARAGPAPAGTATDPGQIPSTVVQGLASQHTTLVEVPTPDPGAIPAEAAANAASMAVPFVGDAVPIEVLVRFTDTDFGPVDEKTDSVVTPTFVDHEAWAVVYQGVQVPLEGGFGMASGGTYAANMVVFVDAQTGNFLLALTSASN